MTAVGTVVIATGLGLIAPLSGSWHPVDLAWRLAVVGIGLGLFAGPNMAVAMQQAPRHLLATAGAATSLARSLAFALGPVLVTIPWALAAYSEGGMHHSVTLSAGLAVLGAVGRAVTLFRGRGAMVADSAMEAEREVA